MTCRLLHGESRIQTNHYSDIYAWFFAALDIATLTDTRWHLGKVYQIAWYTVIVVPSFHIIWFKVSGTIEDTQREGSKVSTQDYNNKGETKPKKGCKSFISKVHLFLKFQVHQTLRLVYTTSSSHCPSTLSLYWKIYDRPN